jgi:hypothetical protein
MRNDPGDARDAQPWLAYGTDDFEAARALGKHHLR